jgi:hypothetical protein
MAARPPWRWPRPSSATCTVARSPDRAEGEACAEGHRIPPAHQALRLRSNGPWSTYTGRRTGATVAQHVSEAPVIAKRNSPGSTSCTEFPATTIHRSPVTKLSHDPRHPRRARISSGCGRRRCSSRDCCQTRSLC